MKKLQRGFTLIEMIYVGFALLIVVGVGGWISNIVKLIGMDFGVITGMLIVRAIGVVVAPLGSVMGFL